MRCFARLLGRLLPALAISLALPALAGAAPVAEGVPQVQLPQGLLRGQRQDDGSVVFRAIPYAAPPLGALRWRPPQPPAPWAGVRDGRHAAPPCAQPALGWNDAMAARGSEDCLYVEVQTPDLAPTNAQPVMVWIHGGANVAGGADGYVPSAFAREGVVLVTVQYRLGVFGFLSLPELKPGLPERAAGNIAVLDQVAALRWVRDNIGRFGGDPRRVTIFGQSAGAQDVGLLQLAPPARGLFQRAIEQSGTAGFGLPARSLEQARQVGEAIAGRAGIAAGPHRMAQLRALPTARLIAAAQGVPVPWLVDPGYVWLQATVDGEVLPAAPAELLAQGRQAPVSLLIGSNAQELRLGGQGGALARLRQDWPAASASVEALLATPASPRQGDASMRLGTDLTFRCPSAAVATAQARAGLPVWRYEFDRAEAGAQVGHSAELGFVFKAHRLDDAGSTLTRYWAAFARDGRPQVQGQPQWAPWRPQQARSLYIGVDGLTTIDDPDSAICAQLPSP